MSRALRRLRARLAHVDWAEVVMWFPRLTIAATFALWVYAYYLTVESL